MKTRHVLLLSLLSVPFAASYASDWPMFRGSMQRTGFYPETIGYLSDEPSWKTTLGGSIVSSPSVSNGILYVGCRDSCLYALDALTGHILWKRKTGGWVDASPSIQNGNIIVGSRDKTIYAFDFTGNDVMRFEGGLQLSSPVLLKNGYLLSGLGYPYKSAAGFEWKKTRWEKVPPSWKLDFQQMSYSSPAVLGGAALIGANDGGLYCLDVSEGRIAWRIQTGGGTYLSTPAVDKKRNLAYFAPGNYDRNIYAVDIVSGKTVWTRQGAQSKSLAKRSEGWPIPSGLLMQIMRYSPKARRQILDGMVGGKGGLAKSSGKKLARSFLKKNSWVPTGGMKTSSVAVGTKNVFVIQKALGLAMQSTEEEVNMHYLPQFSMIALDKENGREQWRFSENKDCIRLGYCSSPVVTEHFVLFGWGSGKAYCLENSTGNVLWSDTLDGDILSSPAIADRYVYFATMAGTVYCYAADSTAAGINFKQSTYCYPNPAPSRRFPATSNIQIFVDRPAHMTMSVYSTDDRPVFRVVRDMGALEKYVYRWNIDKVANGVYLARIKVTYTDGQSPKEEKKTVKIAILK